MRVERALKLAVTPITGPNSRRRLIAARDQAVGAVASVRGRTAGNRVTPQFLVIGAQKAGTTFLYQELMRHAAVRPALTKELHYFDDRYSRGSRWYAGHFPRSAEGVVAGEASPGYLFHPHAPQRVADDLPDARVIAVLRNPVERAFSHWRHERRLGYESIADFSAAVDAEVERTASEIERVTNDPHYVSFAFRHYTYLTRGRYLEQLNRWTTALGSDRLLVLNSDDLFANPLDTLDRVHQFLELEPSRASAPGGNDMATASANIEAPVYTRLTEYFASANRELQTHFEIGGSW